MDSHVNQYLINKAYRAYADKAARYWAGQGDAVRTLHYLKEGLRHG